MIFTKRYHYYYPTESRNVSRKTFCQRKLKVLRTMTKKELLKDFEYGFHFSDRINSNMTRDQILHVVEAFSGITCK